MTSARQQYAIQSLGKLEAIKTDIAGASGHLDRIPMWRPASALKKQCDEALRIITDMEKRLDRKLVVVILGPCGSGKSTLLNALAGVDDLSLIGDKRPTTQNLIAVCRERTDADQLIGRIGQDSVRIAYSPDAVPLENVILVDTPDTDSTEQEKHIPLVLKAIDLSDVLICLFNAENPKRKDYVDFLAPYVARFQGESLVCVLNRCDRLDEHELKESILPEFMTYLNGAWNKPVSGVLCVSAKRHLKHPDWDQKAVPRHDFDQFAELRQLIFGTFNTEGFAVDRRLENAAMLKDYVLQEIGRETEKDREYLKTAADMMADAEKTALQNSLTALKADYPKHVLGVNVLLYQKLAQKWIGPVGWVIAVWARILIFGIGMVSVFRFGNPVRQLIGIASSIMHFKESKAAIAETGKSDRMTAALRQYRFSLMRTWPDIAENLVRSRFLSSVRQSDDIYPDSAALTEELSTIWNDALDNAVEESSQSLSRMGIQFFFNIPAIVVMCYVGWITASNFFAGKYLTGSFFLHASLTVGVVLFLSFFLFQSLVRLAAGQERIMAKAFRQIQQQAEQLHPKPLNPLMEQVEAVLKLK